MGRSKYSLLEAIRPRISEKKYKELCREIEWREQQKVLKKLREAQYEEKEEDGSI